MTREERTALATKIAHKQKELTQKINDVIAEEWGLSRGELILTVVISVKAEEGEKDGSTLQ
jgi:hypothetical protein